MNLLLRHRWLRRVVTVPVTAIVFGLLLALLPVWLIVAAFVSRFAPGRWRALRLTWFFVVYLALELVALAALAAMWVGSGFGRRLDAPVWNDRHHRLLAWFLRRFVGSARFTFGLTFTREGDVDPPDPDRPLILLARHAGAGDSFLLVDAIANGTQRRRPRIVLKDTLQFDPTIDVLLHRVGASFVGPRGRGGDPVAAIAAMAETANADEVVVLFPEGGNVTERRRARAVEKLHEIGRPDLAARAERLAHLLPPKPLGAVTAIEAAPTADVVFVGHAGLEGLSTLRDIWRNLPTDHTIAARLWHVRAEDIPTPEARETWLYDQWEQIDTWLDDELIARADADATARAEARVRRTTPSVTLRQRLGRMPSFGSLVGMLVLWWESLRPSMLPRGAVIQGAVGGICAAIGFLLGGAVQRAVARVLVVRDRSLPGWTRHVVTAFTAVSLLAVVVGPWRWWRWQDAQRNLVAMPSLSPVSIVPMVIVTTVVFVVLVSIGRTVKHGVYRIDKAAAKRLRVSWSRAVVIVVLGAVVLAAAGFGVDRFTRWADTNFGTFDTTNDAGVYVPVSEFVSGGPGSLVSFDDLGYQGRVFVGRTPSAADIAEFAGPDSIQPIRAYVGLRSADSVDERVALAVEELRRTGAFEREVLVVATPTGTGWINPNAARTLEFMYGGDTAIVGVQYSFLPSWVAMLIDTGSPPELGRALFDAVHAAWRELPESSRPTLVAFGESLGSFGGEEAFDRGSVAASLDDMTSRADAALWVGPTRDNPVFGRLIEDRDAASPAWRPAWPDEPNVRVANTMDDITADADDTSAWPEPRVLYLHHPSDAIGTWGWANFWRDPEWSANPPPADLPEAARWFPIVSFAQESFDLMNGFSAAPGYGHDYRNRLTHAWAAIVGPDGWTQADTDRLDAFLGLRP
jgi:uncharacterized membrane protein/1-acyl-sn-glycerol-3-phosphate acyltransferase